MMASVLLGVLLTGVAGQEEDWGLGEGPEPEPEPAGYRKDCLPAMMEAEAIRLQDDAAGGARDTRAPPPVLLSLFLSASFVCAWFDAFLSRGLPVLRGGVLDTS